jgi:hypothetical protein
MLFVNQLTGFGVIAGASGATDPYFANVSLLLHCDGADTSTTFTDNSTTVQTVTPNGNVQIDTAQSQFGGASALFDGTGDYLSLDGSAEFAFGTGDFTIEFWVRFATVIGFKIIYDSRVSGINGANPTIYTSGATLIYFTNGGDRITSGSSLSVDTWYHVAVARSGTDTKMFVDGTQVGSTYTDSTDYENAAGRPFIGEASSGGAAHNGWMDEIRVTKGVARYTANFTAPTAAFPDA